MNYFGSGADGDAVLAVNTSFASTLDGDMIVKNYSSLTINNGVTVTTSNRCKGLLIYVSGDCTINGTLSMTARGAYINPSTAGVSSGGLVIVRESSIGSSTGSPDLNGCGTDAIASEANQSNVNGNGIIITIPQQCGSGGVATVPATGSDGGTVTVGSGGGGSGGGSRDSNGVDCYGTYGSPGTCFSGGSGGGGNSQAGTAATAATYYGGPGGDGAKDTGYGSGCGGGAGNDGGSGNYVGSNYGYDGSDGTGGLLILIVGGNLTIGSTGVISSNGSCGGASGGYGGDTHTAGGGSGGGTIIKLYAGTLSDVGTTTVTGGCAGVANNIGSLNQYYTLPDGSRNCDGGAGGDGSITTYQVDAYNTNTNTNANVIKFYRYGSGNSMGEMQCVIFYDKSGEYGIFPGGNPIVAAVGKVYRSSEIDTFNINNSTSSRSILSLTIPREDMASMQNSSYLWLAGGYNWIDYTGGGRAPQGELNSIEKIKLPTQTSDVIVNTITSVMFANTAVNIRGLYGYMFGGVIDYYNGTNTNVIQKFTMSTETTVDTGQNTSNLAGGLVVVTEFANQSNCWLMGGINVNSSVNIYYNNIDKFNTVTDTNNTSFALVLNDSLAKGNSASSITHGYFIGGDDGVSSGTSDIQRFSYSDTTGTISDRALIPFGSYGGASIIDNNHENVYIYGGNPVIKNVITKYNLTNDTINATVVGSTTREIFQSGHGKV